MRIFTDRYKGIECYVLENENIIARFVSYGAKMVSLFSKSSGKELLWQNTASDSYAIPRYMDDYEEGEFSGFDEMFPQITKCICEEFPFVGVRLPDHGEVWSLVWKTSIGENKIVFSVCGVRLPYRLTKTVSFDEAGCLNMKYQLENLCEFDIRYIWAAHPLFVLEKDMRVVWEKEGRELIITANKSGELGKYGDVIPDAEKFTGRGIGALKDKDYVKYYLKDDNAPDSCALKYADSTSVGIEYITEKNICLGFWINNGGLKNQYNIAPEFCSASMDDIITAKKYNSNCVLEGCQTDKWGLRLSVK
jgi:galactose mutarotase-like enzyme